MIRRMEQELDPADRDERLGEAIEVYLSLAENGHPPDASEFVDRYPDLGDDLRAALEGLELVQGLVGSSSGPGPGHGLESGRRVAGYKIVRELGRGGMGIVYEAVHVGLDRPVALKVLGSNAAPDSSGRRRFLNEARTAAGLHHTHIVPVFDVGQVGGLCYYAMQRIEGSGLDRVIKHLRRDRTSAAGTSTPGRAAKTANDLSSPSVALGLSANGSTASWGRSLSEHDRSHGLERLPRAAELEDEPTPFEPPRGSAYYRWVAEVGRQAADALAHAHLRGVIHRDVKPSNLLVDARSMIWMADFGLARRLADPSQTQVDSLLGTPRYMSPEQARTGPIDGRSDVYSLGATLYELLTLRPPFDGKTAAELIDQIAGREPTPPRQFDRRIPRDLETIVLKALAKRTVDRYASAQDLADDLGRFLALEPVKARRISPIGRAWRVARRHPSLTIVSTVSIVAVLAAWTTAYIRVVADRDAAVQARKDAQKSAQETAAANLETRAALRSQLYREATFQRLSSATNRRSTGLDLLRQAAALGPDRLQKTQFRDEAVALLSLREVVAGRPLPIEGVANLVAIDDRRVAVITDTWEGSTFRLWDLAKAEPIGPAQEMGSPRPDPGPPVGPSPGRGPGPGGESKGGPGPGRGGPDRGEGPPREGREGRGRSQSSRGRWSRLAVIGSKVAALMPDGKGVRLFDVETGMVVGSLPLAGREIVSLYASPDGGRLVTVEYLSNEVEGPPAPETGDRGRNRPGGARGSHQLNLWNPSHAEAPIASLAVTRPESNASAQDVYAAMAQGLPPLVAISPTGSSIAVGWLNEPEVTLFDRDGKRLDTIDSEVRLTALALGPNDVMALAGNGGVQVWDPQAKGPKATLTPHLSVVFQLRFSPDSRAFLAMGGYGSAVEIWDLTSSSAVPLAVLPVDGRTSDLAFTPGGKSLAVPLRDSVSVWSIVDPAAQIRIAGPQNWLSSLDFGPAGDLVMASHMEPPQFWKPGECTFSGGKGPAVEPSSVAYDARGRLISIDDARMLRIDPATGKVETRIGLPETEGERVLGERVKSLVRVARPAGADFVAFARLNEIYAWSADEPKRVHRIELHDASARPRREGGGPGGPGNPGRQGWWGLCVSPEGDRLYMLTGNRAFRAYELDVPRSGRLAERLLWKVPDDGSFTALALSPDGRVAALGETNGRVLLISTDGGGVIGTLPAPADEGERSVQSLTFSPDGAELAVAVRENVYLWSVADRSPLVRLPGDRGNVTALAYDDQGQRLASGGGDKTVKVWNLKAIRQRLVGIGLGW